MANIDKIQEELDKQIAIREEAGEKAEKLRDELDSARVSSFDKKVVDRAKELGINPRNFETEEQLNEAIRIINPNEDKED